MKFSESENCPKLPPPALGQHSEEILRDILGYSDEAIQSLVNDKVVQLIWIIITIWNGWFNIISWYNDISCGPKWHLCDASVTNFQSCIFSKGFSILNKFWLNKFQFGIFLTARAKLATLTLQIKTTGDLISKLWLTKNFASFSKNLKAGVGAFFQRSGYWWIEKFLMTNL